MEGDLQKFLDELRSKLSVADIVAEKVKLVRKGREYIGLCPFHNEKTPSFTVNEAKGFYHCFGCGAHGDIIRFEMEANVLPFMQENGWKTSTIHWQPTSSMPPSNDWPHWKRLDLAILP